MPVAPDWIRRASVSIELDYHPGDANAPVYGQAWTDDRLREYLEAVRPDCVLPHALGCLGWSAYESAVAPHCPDLRPGFLERVRRACEATGVRLGLYVASFDGAPGARCPRPSSSPGGAC